MNDKELKSILLKEASQRLAPSNRSYNYKLSKAEQKIVEQLLREANTRIARIKESDKVNQTKEWMPPAPEQLQLPTEPLKIPEMPTFEDKTTPPKPTPKPLLGTDKQDFVKRRENKRTLIKHRPDPISGKLQHASVIKNLMKVADKLDQAGEILLVNKIDFLLEKLSEVNQC